MSLCDKLEIVTPNQLLPMNMRGSHVEDVVEKTFNLIKIPPPLPLVVYAKVLVKYVVYLVFYSKKLKIKIK